jgi:EAL domain-containing protein (putative c-di-GMP-specific phosphodiesterase class I)
VLAEGVETASELQFLSREAACSEVQGYLIGRPCEIEQLRHYTHGVAAPGDAASEPASESTLQRRAG